MNLSSELLINLIQAVIDNEPTLPDVLWSVTSLRTDIYCMFKQLGLSRAGQTKDQMQFNRELAIDIFCDYARVLASFPAEIKYTDDNIETPRRNAVNRTFEIVQGLQSDDDTWTSAQELVRLVATNADSEHQKLDYSILMGIMLKIFSLLEIDTVDVCQAAIASVVKKTEA